MADEKKRGVAESVRELASPIINALGLQLWDVRFVKEGADWILRLIIDKPDGICIDDCVAVNDALEQPLDEWNLIDRPYRLQVQSPGVERELTREEHFQQYIGERVKLRLHRAVNERKEYAGVLSAYADGVLTLTLDDGSELAVRREEASRIRADDFNDFQSI